MACHFVSGHIVYAIWEMSDQHAHKHILIRKSKDEGKDKEPIQSTTTRDGNVSKTQENTAHREQRLQPFLSRCSQGYKEQTRQHNKDKHET